MARLSLTRRTGAVLSGVLALGLAACSGDEGGSSTPSGTSGEASSTAPSGAPSGGETAPGSASPSSETAAPKESDPKKVLQDSEASVRGSRTVVLTLSSHDDDQTYRARSRGRIDGTNQRTIFDYGKRGKLEARIVDGTYYIKGDKRYWDALPKLPAGEKVGLANKWLTVPEKDEHRFSGARIDRVLMSLQRDLDPTSVTKSNTSMSSMTHQGKPAYKVLRQGDEGDSDEMLTVVVDGTRKHLPLQATEDGDRLTFSGWDTVDPVTKPTGPSAAFPKVPNDD